MKEETLVSICNQMRCGQMRENYHVGSYQFWYDLANRIEEAHKREREAVVAGLMLADKIGGEAVERMTNALKPILEHDTEQYGHGRCLPAIVLAVREAQAIMKGVQK